VVKKAQKQVKGELEALLRSHAKYVKKQLEFEDSAKQSALEKMEASIGLTNGTISSTLSSTIGLQSTTTDSSSLVGWSGVTIIVGLALLAFAVILIFVIKPKERSNTPLPRRVPKKKTKGEDMTSADYDPPAF
jgi:ABC-type microcin C transport system permease subunit YejB